MIALAILVSDAVEMLWEGRASLPEATVAAARAEIASLENILLVLCE